MDNKDIKMLKLLFDKAASDGEKINIINMLNRKYNNDVVQNIISQHKEVPQYEGLYREGYTMFKNKYNTANDIIHKMSMEKIELNIKIEKLEADLYSAKICSVCWFSLLIIVSIINFVFF